MDKVSREKLPPLPPRRAGQRQLAAARHRDCDDEQVEKFYELLHNIRAERHLFKLRQTNCRKRLRMEEPPWKPAFTMQDFEEAKGGHVGGPSNTKPADHKVGAKGETSSGSRDTGGEDSVKEVDLRLTLSLG